VAAIDPDPQVEMVTPYQQKRRNYRYVQVDAVGIGLAGAASTFLPVFLARLGATAVQVGLLTSMPALTGLIMSIPIGRFLQTRRNIVPWFSSARLLVVSAYALTGIVPFLVPDQWIVPAVLIIWALATLPQSVVMVGFSVVMNAVAGPEGRFDLMSRRWSILGLTNAITVAVVGQALSRMGFPINYQLVFMALSIGGLISYAFSSRIKIPDNEPVPSLQGLSVKEKVADYLDLVRSQPDFLSFVLKRLVYLFGMSLAAPLFPLYYVRVLDASDASIGLLSTTATICMLFGYYLWTRQSRRRGTHFVLLVTTLGTALYPALVAVTSQIELIMIYAGIAGIFQAGVDLVFFDELMRTVPPRYAPTFVSLAQSLSHLAAIIAPLVGTYLSLHIGLSGALLVSAGLRLLGFAMFASTDILALLRRIRPGTDRV